MASPANPLDVFTTYTTHFELHAAGTWDDLLKIAETDNPTKSTTRRSSNGTLLINTRCDAHQNIDNVRYTQTTNDGDPTATMVAFGSLTMDISEPGGMFFTEKIRQHALKYSVSGITDGLIFGLKIFFVGRTPENEIVTIPLPSIIPMQIIGMDSRFDFKGGDYKMTFVISAFGAAPSIKSKDNGLAKAAGYSNKNITIKATTINEALGELESKLNENYAKTYETELKNDVGAKKLVYKITNKSGLDGKLNLITTQTFAQGEVMNLTFQATDDITSMVRKIMFSSKEVNEIIGASRAGLKKSYHPGVKIPAFTPRFLLKDGEVEIGIDVTAYEGGGKTYNFDFLFSEPGKNVDVMEFECKFPNMFLWLNSKTTFCAEVNNNFSSTVPADEPLFYSNNLITLDKTIKKLIQDPIEQFSIPIPKGNTAFLNQLPNFEKNGLVRVHHSATPSTRLAFHALSDLVGATGFQFTFTIRGHLDMLADCIAYPDGSKQAFGSTTGMWIKVNIKDQDGQPFFYQDPYRVFTIDNIFSGGKFTQLLTVLMDVK